MKNNFSFWGVVRLILVLLIPLCYIAFFYLHQYTTESSNRKPLGQKISSVFWNQTTPTKDNKTLGVGDIRTYHPPRFDSLPRKALVGSKYWVLYNHVKASKQFGPLESITFASHGEYGFLDNVGPVLERWRGPLSMAIFAPGDDYRAAIQHVHYYRKCGVHSDLIRDFATFHIFFPIEDMPPTIDDLEILDGNSTCDTWPMVKTNQVNLTYRAYKRLDYPVNVGRMISRESITTHFVFVADVELYPSPGLIPKFLDMVQRNKIMEDNMTTAKNKTVYVTPIFEIRKGLSLPKNKTELLPLIKAKDVQPFHQAFCAECHTVPYYKQWLKAKVSDNLNIFRTAKRHGLWEPIYIGTNEDPPYDTRLSWEGQKDKMTQGFILCVLDYDFALLDNAFLIHRPGFKTKTANRKTRKLNKISAQTSMITKKIMPELKLMYGDRVGCKV